ncbi:glycoside hydrolase family 97 protein [Hymenobacter sp. GOD-10R]|uniref:glycoside hydrolase family 97 protein n=1 Tax=Hymenobacter sp. GOD-10R TaxID=3093922 RepID=UPI002D79F0CE|nr:glycoside hydrolase family 97 catalytic domain-containing protein [Hymenobacter sp. GOD-10R]WRQ31123.1 glycoside hydrolase family 97 catalytic domain-containing protein [Hymenobacter sp. GOD-10R]
MKFLLFLLLLLPLWLAAEPKQSAPTTLAAAPVKTLPTLVSPNKRLCVQFSYDPAGALTYTFSAQSKVLLQNSKLGLQQSGPLAAPTVLRRTVNTVWKPVWGKRAVVLDQYNELTLDLKTYKIMVRAYDQGIAFRYAFPAGQTVTERTTFAFAGNYTAWYYNGENHNLGPEKLADCNGKRSPVMTIQVDSVTYLALHEADLGNGEPLLLQAKQGDALFTIASQATTSWKVVMYGNTPGDLVDSHLLELLNPAPARGQDFSWVKPGVALWDWRINGARTDGFTYDMSLPSWKRMVDFAAANQFPYLVLDADWYGPEFGKASDPVKGGKVAQVHELIAYGKSKGVGIWLYLNDVGGRHYALDQTLKRYHDWGAVGIKYGFMSGTPAEKNQRTRLITELCAQNRLLCDFHDGPTHPYGQLRTFPNAVTREYCKAQLDGHQVVEPRTFVTSVFVNMVAGPLDMGNGFASLTQAGRVDNSSPVPSTLAGEAARTLIVFSGATILPDIPENYQQHPELLRFIAAQKMPWLASKTVQGQIGEYIVMARQAQDKTWLVGAATNEQARELTIPLTFLGPGRYTASIVQDGPQADYRTQHESYTTETKQVSAMDVLRVKLAPGGGACVLLKQD